jgi:peptidoglycan/xylan/chitin deacetylase (PgdA/CDA1 family)
VDEPTDRLRERRIQASAARARRVRRRRLTAIAGLVCVAILVWIGLSRATGPRSAPPKATAPHSNVPASGRSATATGGAGQPAAIPPSTERAALLQLASHGLPVYCGATTKPMVALTFDDGPGPYTRLVVNKLRKRHLRVTFFLVGKQIGFYPGLAATERPVGAVADHTMTHPVLPGLSESAMVDEIAAAKTLIERTAGQPVEIFRPPYGARSPAIDAAAKALGLVEVIWTIDSRDSEGADYAQIAHNVIAGLHPGSIILMHENRGQTVRALASILPALKRSHLQPVTLPTLLSADPPTLAQLRAGGSGCGRGAGAVASGAG